VSIAVGVVHKHHASALANGTASKAKPPIAARCARAKWDPDMMSNEARRQLDERSMGWGTSWKGTQTSPHCRHTAQGVGGGEMMLRLHRQGSGCATIDRMEPTSTEIVHAALDALLLVVAKSADDLRTFHDAVAKARRAPLPPFPRATVVLTERIVERLTKVDRELEEVLAALGLLASGTNDG